MTGTGNVLGDNTTAVSGLTSVVGGAVALPNTGSNMLLAVLSVTTISLGVVLLAAFVVTRVLVSRYSR